MFCIVFNLISRIELKSDVTEFKLVMRVDATDF